MYVIDRSCPLANVPYHFFARSILWILTQTSQSGLPQRVLAPGAANTIPAACIKVDQFAVGRGIVFGASRNNSIARLT